MITIKGIFTDLDGTLLGSDGNIPPGNLEMIQNILKKYPEAKIVFTTGTGPERAIKYVQQCGLDQQEEQYMICYNGGAIIKLFHGEQEVIWRKALSVKQGQDITKMAKKHKAELQVYSVENEKVLWLENVEKFNAEKLSETQQDIMDQDFLYKGILFFKEDKKETTINKIIAELKKNNPKFEITRSKLSNSHDLFKTYPNASGISIEINPKGVDKGEAVKKLSEILGISLEHEVLAIGDEMNDLAMLKVAGCSVYVENANKEIKNVAKFPTGSNNDSGFAEAIQDYVIEGRHVLSQEFYSLVNNFDDLFEDNKNLESKDDKLSNNSNFSEGIKLEAELDGIHFIN